MRTWRLDSGKTLEEVAFRAECSYPHLCRLEDLGGNPSAALLARITAVYDRDADRARRLEEVGLEFEAERQRALREEWQRHQRQELLGLQEWVRSQPPPAP